MQAEIIAGAIAASATVETNAITVDPERLVDLKPGETYGPNDETLTSIDFPINPERVAPVLRRLISPTKTRARIYDRDGVLVLDSRNLYGRGDVLRFELPPPSSDKPGLIEKTMIAVRTWLNRGDLPLYRELGPENGNGYQEVQQALDGRKASMVRINDRGEVIVSVSVPVQRFRAVHGALMLSTQGDDIDQMVTAERLAILKVFGIAAGVMVVLSLLLASTILLSAGSAHAQTFSDAFAGFGSNDGEPIEIEASELRVEDNNNTATFVGDVLVTQGETSLKTQRLKVFYVGSGAEKTEESAVQQKISKLEAAGGVFITSKDQTAKGDEASFDMNKEVMVMTGKEVVLSQGPNVVVGNRLTVNLKTGQANLSAGNGKVSGQGSGRVKVRIQPNSVNNDQNGN